MIETKSVTLPDAQYKDEHPLNTVSKIKNILKNFGIETNERVVNAGVPYCFSCRISVKGTTFGVNGKGLTEEFALASGYGEFMERIQLGLVGSSQLQKSGQMLDIAERGQDLDAQWLLQENRAWYEAMAEKLYRFSGVRLSAEEVLMQYADADGKVRVASFYNLTKKKKAYVPIGMYMSLYGSNGCAAGNTIEEAIVQAVSEIEERYHQAKILIEQRALPEIPDEVLQKFEHAYRIITYLREKGYRVHVKDCTLGDKYPVVCACFIDSRTGRYHTHFGASPVLQIAVERALTETFQGRTVDKFTEYDQFSYNAAGVLDMDSLYREFRVGEAAKTPQFFVGESATPWNSQAGFTGSNNRQMLREVLKYYADQGHDVLVRNGAGLGFPACQVLVPGRSETMIHNLSPKLNPFRFSPSATRAVKNPSNAKLDDYIGLMQHLREMRANLSVDGSGFIKALRLSIKVSPAEDAYILSAALGYVSYALGKHKDALDCVSKMVPLAPEGEQESLICLKRYLAMKLNGFDEAMVKKTLEYFHNPETVSALYTALEKKENPFDRYTLHCGTVPCENCPVYEKCGQEKIDWLLALGRTKREALDFDAFADSLQKLLAE